jgi:hypothetical protein
VVVWDVERGERALWPAASEADPADVACLSADGKTLALGLSEEQLEPCNPFGRAAPGKIVAWDLPSGAKLSHQEEPRRSNSSFGLLAVSPDGKRVAVGLHFWDGDDWRNAVKIWPVRKR